MKVQALLLSREGSIFQRVNEALGHKAVVHKKFSLSPQVRRCELHGRRCKSYVERSKKDTGGASVYIL